MSIPAKAVVGKFAVTSIEIAEAKEVITPEAYEALKNTKTIIESIGALIALYKPDIAEFKDIVELNRPQATAGAGQEATKPGKEGQPQTKVPRTHDKVEPYRTVVFHEIDRSGTYPNKTENERELCEDFRLRERVVHAGSDMEYVVSTLILDGVVIGTEGTQVKFDISGRADFAIRGDNVVRMPDGE
ncbi:hypothetical protein B9Z65_1188 [Elsinoe australis]|uniref:Uncharacterized protein n=1 Tax=Elsinoe australis TaxID=40998 RepID=A0A2P7YPV4_9PEZI|nr:hypothetical protein B9Z65_1188 [Elsinoe australis]